MFFITCFEYIKPDKFCHVDMGDCRTFGYKETFEKAKSALNGNYCDMNETIYNYAVVEKIGPGIHPDVQESWFFKYNRDKDGFFEIEAPELFKRVTNIALG